MADRLTMREVLELVRDCSSQEWQQPDGKRMAATDNSGQRFWFITEDVMRAVREVLGAPPVRRVTADQIERAGQRAMKRMMDEGLLPVMTAADLPPTHATCGQRHPVGTLCPDGLGDGAERRVEAFIEKKRVERNAGVKGLGDGRQ